MLGDRGRIAAALVVGALFVGACGGGGDDDAGGDAGGDSTGSGSGEVTAEEIRALADESADVTSYAFDMDVTFTGLSEVEGVPEGTPDEANVAVTGATDLGASKTTIDLDLTEVMALLPAGDGRRRRREHDQERHRRRERLRQPRFAGRALRDRRVEVGPDHARPGQRRRSAGCRARARRRPPTRRRSPTCSGASTPTRTSDRGRGGGAGRADDPHHRQRQRGGRHGRRTRGAARADPDAVRLAGSTRCRCTCGSARTAPCAGSRSSPRAASSPPSRASG